MKTHAKRSVLVLLVTMVAVASPLSAESRKLVDASGTWRWEHDGQAGTISNVLRLTLDGEKLTGVYQGRGKPTKLTDGKIDGDEVSVSFPVEYDGLKLNVQLIGVIKGDDLAGSANVTGSGVSEQLAWRAKRSLRASDVVGTWALEIDTPEGTNSSELVVDMTAGKKLTAKLKGTRGEFVEVDDLLVKDNRLRFTVTGEFDGTFLTARYLTKPLGDKLTGTMDYDYGGQVGELTVKGKRKQN